MQEISRTIRRFFVAHGPKTLIGAMSLVAVAAAGWFLFGGNTFGTSSADPDVAAEVLPNENVASVSDLDTDQDGLRDLDEHRYRTDPKDADTDADGYSDGQEVEHGFDPLAAPQDSEAQAAALNDSATGAQKPDDSLLSLMGLSGVSGQIDGLNVGGLGGLPEAQGLTAEEKAGLEQAVLPSGERLADLELDALLNQTSYPLPTVDVRDIQISNKTDQAAEQAYLNHMYGIVVRFNPFPAQYNLKKFLTDIEHYNRDLFEKMKLSGESMDKEMRAVSVPKNLAPYHAQALAQLAAANQALQNILDSNGAPDDTLFLMGRTFFLTAEFQALLKAVVNEMQS